MTYERLFQLKFKEEVPTHQLGKQFPKERRKISRLALMELPLSRLRKVIKNEEEFRKLLLLKEWLLKRNGGKVRQKARRIRRVVWRKKRRVVNQV